MFFIFKIFPIIIIHTLIKKTHNFMWKFLASKQFNSIVYFISLIDSKFVRLMPVLSFSSFLVILLLIICLIENPSFSFCRLFNSRIEWTIIGEVNDIVVLIACTLSDANCLVVVVSTGIFKVVNQENFH